MSGDFLRLSGLVFAYPGGPRLFDGAELSLAEGERVGLTADNGSGKSTLLRLIVGLLRPLGGQVIHRGRPARSEADYAALRRELGFLLQDPDDQLFFPEVIDDVMFGPLNLGQEPAAARDTAARTLAELGLSHLAWSDSLRLSPGQKKLVALAAVLACGPSALLLDEPATGLDRGAREHLLRALDGFGGPLLVVSHDRQLLRRLGCRALTIRAGRVLPLED